MKRMKKIVSLLLAMVMVFAMTVIAGATEGTSTTYTISAPNGSTHTYEVFQIFTGDLSDGVLSNVKWGQNGTGTTGEAVAQGVLDTLTGLDANASDTTKLETITTYASVSDTDAFGEVTASNPLTGVPAGYYLIKDKDNSITGNDAYTLYIVEVVGNVEITPKSDTPEFQKKVKDTNDSTANSTTGWQDSADYDIGDAVPFQLKGTVADNYADYTTYYFAFHDKEEEGLTFDSTSVKVYVDDVLIDTGYTLNTALTDGCTFEVVFSNLKDITSVSAGSVITVEYTSTLNDQAVLGSQGNVNQAKLEYSNNPNDTQGGGHGTTPWDNVIVFTYKVVVDKVNENNEALAGAEFTLKKKLADNTEKEIAVVKNEAGTEFTFKGLDDGTYVLSETKTPAGYNTIADITFTVEADHTITWEGETRTTILTRLSGSDANTENGIAFTGDTTEGSLSADVVNKSGATLPTTGGIGTTIFYVIGTILVLAAAILLITKKRMSSEK